MKISHFRRKITGRKFCILFAREKCEIFSLNKKCENFTKKIGICHQTFIKVRELFFAKFRIVLHFSLNTFSHQKCEILRNTNEIFRIFSRKFSITFILILILITATTVRRFISCSIILTSYSAHLL